jgi:hypothetical protein
MGSKYHSSPSHLIITDTLTANSALASAQEKARLTEAAYTSAQANYQKSVENRSKVQQDLAKIKANLSSLSLQKASLVRVQTQEKLNSVLSDITGRDQESLDAVHRYFDPDEGSNYKFGPVFLITVRYD